MLTKIKRRIQLADDSQDELLMDLITQNEDYIKLYLGVEELEDSRLDSVVMGMTIDAWVKLGEEGKISSIYSDYRSDFPKQLINPYKDILQSIRNDLQRTIRFF